jgi:hypothetical protein
MRSLLASLLLAFPLLLTACPGSVETSAEPGFLERTWFELPQDGAANANGTIGPYCCTGHTATVMTTAGYPAGYVYFFSWKGDAYNVGDTAFASDVQVNIAGLADVHDAQSTLVQSEVDFTAAEMEVGAQKVGIAGQLEYTVSIEVVTLEPILGDGTPFFDMSTLVVRVDVAVVP